MNPIPVGSLVRSLVSLAKDSARVADKVDRFPTNEKPMGTPMRLIASEVRAMGDVGQEFGDVIDAIGEDRSKRLLSRRLPDMTTVENTVQSCRNVLEEIENAISKATKRLATDPYDLDHVVRLTKREREAYGLTDIDLRILYFKVRRAVADLSLQKESLIFADFRTEHSRVRENDGEVRVREKEIREHEREIQHLTERFEKMTDTLLRTLRERDKIKRGDELQYKNLYKINEEARKHGLPDSFDDTDAKLRAGSVLSHRREWNSKPQSSSQQRFSKYPSSNGDKSRASNITHNSRAGEVTGSEGFENPESVISDTPVDLEAWQFSGSITSASSQTSKMGESYLIPASSEDILSLLAQQRKRKTLSALKQYPLLVADVQDQIHNRIAEKEKVSGLRWSIASIEIERPKTFQKWRGVRTESARIVLQGHLKEFNQQPKVLATHPFVMNEGPSEDGDQITKISESFEDLNLQSRRNGHHRPSQSRNARRVPHVIVPQHGKNHNREIKRLKILEDESENDSDEDSDDSWGSFKRQRPENIKYTEDFQYRAPRNFVATDSGRVDEVGIDEPVREAAVASERERTKQRRKTERTEHKRQKLAEHEYQLPLGGTAYPPPPHTLLRHQIEYGEPVHQAQADYGYPPLAPEHRYSAPIGMNGYSRRERDREPRKADENVLRYY